MILQLLQPWACVLDVADAPKGPEVVDVWSLAVLGFKRRLAVERTRRRSVQDVHSGGDGFPPEVSRQVLGFEHAACHGHDTLVPAFHHPILLRGIRSGELPVHAALCTVPAKLNRGEFPPRSVRRTFNFCPVSTSTPAWKFLIADAV